MKCKKCVYVRMLVHKMQVRLMSCLHETRLHEVKCHFTIENVLTQYNRNVNLPQVNVSHVNMA